MTEGISWSSGDVEPAGDGRRRINWREIGKMVLLFIDEFIIALLILYILYKIFW